MVVLKRYVYTRVYNIMEFCHLELELHVSGCSKDA